MPVRMMMNDPVVASSSSAWDSNTNSSSSHAPVTAADPSNSFFEHAAHNNADGVVCLQNGDCGKAFQSFVTTLTTLQKFRSYLMAKDTSTPESLPSPSSCKTRPKNCKAIAVPYLEDTGFHIYTNAVIFSRKPHIGPEELTGDATGWQLDTIAFCEAVAQFNLGLAYHQRGKYCGEDRTLLGALELYEQSMTTLESIKDLASDEIKTLQLAVMNNRIHILNEMARYPAAQLLVNDLLLQSINALNSKEAHALSFLTRADIDNFLLNALVIRRFNTAPCA